MKIILRIKNVIVIKLLICIFVSNSPGQTSGLTSGSKIKPGMLTFNSSDEKLNRAFEWAKEQAMKYVNDGDPVGKWYEAALPKREAFCMRDASHQAVGAHALGLQDYTVNMMKKFAVNISEERDWCTFWEINKENKPAPVDYRNDKEFWYNLPANFDVLDACFRMYLWSGDKTYIENTAFLEFYEHTVKDYVLHWHLITDRFLTRGRFMHRESYDPDDYYQYCRGIPSYHEGEPGKLRLGIDLLAFQAAAYRSYSRMLRLTDNTAKALYFELMYDEIRQFINKHYWNESEKRFYELLLTDGKFVFGGYMDIYLLYNDVLDSPERIDGTLKAILERSGINIEMRSYLPEIFYRYGKFDKACQEIIELSDVNTKRREYPEVSFAVVGAFSTGLMGINPDWESNDIGTISGLTEKTSWAQLNSMPFRKNIIDIRHNGQSETVLSNRAGKNINWKASFYGKFKKLYVDGNPVNAKNEKDIAGKDISFVKVNVDSGKSLSVGVK